MAFFLKQRNSLKNNAFKIGKAKLGMDLGKESRIGHFEVVILQDILMAFYSALLEVREKSRTEMKLQNL